MASKVLCFQALEVDLSSSLSGLCHQPHYPTPPRCQTHIASLRSRAKHPIPAPVDEIGSSLRITAANNGSGDG